jgi:hypothetical protein
MMDQIVPEYALMARRCLGPGAEAWLQQVTAMLPAMGGMARVGITPGMGRDPRLPAALPQRDRARASHGHLSRQTRGWAERQPASSPEARRSAMGEARAPGARTPRAEPATHTASTAFGRAIAAPEHTIG